MRLALALIGLLIFAPAYAQPLDWQQYKPASIGFSVELPGKPELSRQEGAVAPGVDALVAFNRQDPAKTLVFLVKYTEYPPRPDSEAVLDVLSHALAGKYTLLSEQKEMLGGYPARRFTLEAHNNLQQMRVVITNRYLIQVLFGGPLGDAMGKRYLESLTIIK